VSTKKTMFIQFYSFCIVPGFFFFPEINNGKNFFNFCNISFCVEGGSNMTGTICV
jgi:hypothetical protein